jgi:hypothetical protein
VLINRLLNAAPPLRAKAGPIDMLKALVVEIMMLKRARTRNGCIEIYASSESMTASTFDPDICLVCGRMSDSANPNSPSSPVRMPTTRDSNPTEHEEAAGKSKLVDRARFVTIEFLLRVLDGVG